VKKFLIFFTVFPIDQSEAELQIVSRVSRHDVIRCRFWSVTKIECIFMAPNKKNKRKTHLKKQNFMFNKKKVNLFHTNFIFRVDHRDGSSRVHQGWRGGVHEWENSSSKAFGISFADRPKAKTVKKSKTRLTKVEKQWKKVFFSPLFFLFFIVYKNSEKKYLFKLFFDQSEAA
jgi:hypothetical protein